MVTPTKRLRIPMRLRAVMMGGVATFACASTPPAGPPKDGGPLSEAASAGPDASFDGGRCTITIPPGTICETTCYNIRADPISPFACQVYCTPPDEGGPGSCSCNGGLALEGGTGLCPDGVDCQLDATDGGTRVFC